jgi:hypothetical protein
VSADPALLHGHAAQALHRYCRSLDRLDAELLRKAFHPDAEIDLGALYRGGVEGFIEVAMAFMGAMAITRHEVTNLLAEADGEALKVEAYVRAWHLMETPEGPQELIVLARYLQRLEVRDGRWAITRHAEVMDWGEMRPVSRAWFDANAELPKGRRDRSDASYG